MPILPARIMTILSAFAPLFYRRVWRHVPLLLVGAIHAPGGRTISSVLRVLGLSHLPSFQTYHRVLNRAHWSSLAASRILLDLLVRTFVPHGPLVVGIDETLERRRGAKISAAGIYRDPVRSSHSHFFKVRALRWVCAMLLVPLPWAARTWALPFLTSLAPSERYAQERGQRHKAVTEWARQIILLLHRWYPQHALVVVGDQEYAAREVRAATREVATLVTRLRLDARLFAPPPPRERGQRGRPRLIGSRQQRLDHMRDDPQTPWTALRVPWWFGERNRSVEIVSQTALWYHTGVPPVPLRWVLIRDPRGVFRTQALLCTDQDATPEQIIAWFVLRWQVESTFHEVRDHLGVETQRQWSTQAIARTTPVLLGLFSIVTVLAHARFAHCPPRPRQAAWYAKATPTFSDALALVRYDLWTQTTFRMSPADTDLVQIPRAFLDHLYALLSYAA